LGVDCGRSGQNGGGRLQVWKLPHPRWIFTRKDDIVVKAELPGMEKDNIEVNLSDNRLSIKGEKKQEGEVKKEGYYRSERSYGSFVRTLELPRKVQTDKVKAAFKSGILEIRLPKTEQAKKKETTVKVD
jgi:HSP20 family protein